MANNKISDEEIEWISKHKQSIERRTRMLKSVKIYAVYLIMVASAVTFIVAITANISHVYIAIDAVVFLAFAIISVIHIKDALSENDFPEVAGIASGIIVAGVITLLYIAPIASISQYPISMQVFYPNYPNLTITQNCTDFTTSASSYINGQPMNPKNTTQCNLPPRITQNATEPFNCGIIGKKITCINAIFGVGNEVWQGTILNVSKR